MPQKIVIKSSMEKNCGNFENELFSMIINFNNTTQANPTAKPKINPF